jgi:hypothetical protein
MIELNAIIGKPGKISTAKVIGAALAVDPASLRTRLVKTCGIAALDGFAPTIILPEVMSQTGRQGKLT